jgi:hypothetical protein
LDGPIRKKRESEKLAGKDREKVGGEDRSALHVAAGLTPKQVTQLASVVKEEFRDEEADV